MIWLAALLSVYLVIALVNLFTAVICGFDKPPRLLSDEELPEVAVLVAARNEERVIETCLESLLAQNYPKEKLHILVGNDQSTDRTAKIVDNLAKQNPSLKQIHITQTLGKAKGKANVLARLAQNTTATYLLITDADIETGPEWARTLVSFFTPETGIVSGTTVVRGAGFMERMQQTDWMYFMGLLLTFDRFRIRSTAVGNNMAVRRQAYLDTGGYEHIDFSVTEDYKLFEQVRRKGWKTVNMINPGAINFSAAASDLKTLLNQRKRWLTGARELPFYWWIIFALFGSFVPAFILLLFISPGLALGLYAAKLLVQSATILVQQRMIGIKRSVFHLLWYEGYTIVLTLCTALFYLLPVKLNWKNRYY